MACGGSRHYYRFEIVDYNGKALSKTVPARHKHGTQSMYVGAPCAGGNSEVLTFPEEVMNAGCPNSDLVPDWSTEQELPWAGRPDRGIKVSRVYCEQQSAIGEVPLPRTVCRKLLDELRGYEGLGLELFVGGELEFTLAKQNKDTAAWEPYWDGVDIFCTLQNEKGMDFAYEVETAMEAVGVDILTMNAEYGTGQLEITWVPKFGLEALDATATFRTGTKEMAWRRGLRASFMARPFGVSGVGNGGHFNFSLWRAGSECDLGDGALQRATAGYTNLFHCAEDDEGLSPIARQFLAGILAHAPALEALCAPAPPCYTRHGNWAPVCANWGRDNRTVAVRVKADKRGSGGGCYMELRMPSAAANAYLVTAGIVAAGLDGLGRTLELPPALQTQEAGALALPVDLEQSLQALEADAYMVGKLGPAFVRWFTGIKRAELKAIEERLSSTDRSDDEVSKAWQHMYMEFI